MKKLTLLLLTLFFSLAGYSQLALEGFESTTGPDVLPSTNWTLGTGDWKVFQNTNGTNLRWNTISNVTAPPVVYAGTNSAYMARDNSNIGEGNFSEDFLVTPLVNIPQNGELHFYTRSFTTGDQGTTAYEIRIAPEIADPLDPLSYTLVRRWTEADLTATFNLYEEKIVDLSPYYNLGTNWRVAFVMINTQIAATPNSDRWLVDNVSISSRCDAPTTLGINSIGLTSATLTWQNPTGASTFVIEVLPATFAPTGNGFVFNSTNALNQSLPITTTLAAGVPLTPSTDYKFYVRATCSDGTNSAWTGPFPFTTLSPGLTCDAPIVVGPLPYSTTDDTGNYNDNYDVQQPAACAGAPTNYMAGNDVFYTYTATANGAIKITLSPNATNASVYVYSSCANVGVNCINGVANNTANIREITSVPVVAGQTYIIVISSALPTQSYGYTLNIQRVNCAEPDNLGVTGGVGQTTAGLSWNNPGAATNLFVDLDLATAPLTTGNGVAATTSTSYNATTLLANTVYRFYVRADCGDGTFSAWAGPFTFRTQCTSFNVPFQETFDSTSTTEACWSVLNENTDSDQWNTNYDLNPFEGDQVAAITTEEGDAGSNDDWLISPQIILTGNQRLKYRYRVQSAGEPNEFRVMISTTGNTPANFTTTLVPLATYNNTEYIEQRVNLSAYTGPVNIAWNVPPATLDGWRLFIDNVIIEDLPTCPEPNLLPATDVLATTATINLTAGGTETAWQYILVPCDDPAPTATSTGWIDITTTSTPLSGLESATCFDVYARSVCSLTDSSPIVGPISFTTQVLPPECGGNFTDPGGVDAQYDNNVDSTVTICPTSPGEVVTVTFTSFNTEPNWDGLYVFDGNSTAAPQIASTNGPGNGGLTLAGAFWGTNITCSFTSTSPDGCLTFRFISDTSATRDGWVATVSCAPPSTCATPLTLTNAIPTHNSVDVSWTQPQNPDGSTATQWEVFYQECAGPAPTADTVPQITGVTAFPATISGLNPMTCYDIYVRAVCSDTSLSAWSCPISITTQVAPPVCGGIYVDEGGTTGQYEDDTDSVVTICPTSPGEVVTVTFTSFNTEANWDGLYVFDGNSINAPQIASENGPGNGDLTLAGAYWGTNVPCSFTSSSPDGCLTFRFISDGFGTRDGWVASVTCSPAATCATPLTITNTVPTYNSVDISWTQPLNPDGSAATQWEIFYQECGGDLPTADTVPQITGVTAFPATIPGLTPLTCYDIYVRAVCSETDRSQWSCVKSITTQAAPPVCGGNFTDQAGPTAQYANNSDSIVTICPEPGSGALVTVDFTSFNTEDNFDGLYIYNGADTSAPIIPSGNGPGNGALTEPGAFWGTGSPGRIRSSSPDGCLTFRFISDGGGTRDGWIANVTCPTCFDPINLTATGLIGSYNVDLTWTPVGTETQWEVIVQTVGTPPPGSGSVGTIVNTPSFSYLASEDIFYEFYVRAICSDTDISVWSNPEQFSIYIPPGCASVDVVGVGIDIVDSSIVICPDSNVDEVNLAASFFGIDSTTSYEVESIEYNPPYPFTGGIEMPITADDDYTASFTLPFNFCFFGESYNYCQVGDNGIIAFGRPFTTTYGQFCEWDLDNIPIPNPNFPTLNAIYGVYQDTHVINNPSATTSINYQVLGTSPCRALVVNFNEVPAFGGECDAEEFRMTTQIVLYEISNIIEVYVKKRTACTGWSEGQGVIGIQNGDGSLAYSPPGRNNDAVWSTIDEAWRFLPNGESDVTLNWFMDGVPYGVGNEENIAVVLTPEQQAQLAADLSLTVEMEVVATYATCTPGEEVIKTANVDIVYLIEFPDNEPNDLVSCSTTTTAIFNLTQNNSVLLGTFDPSIFTITYYLSEADALVPQNAITDPTAFEGTNGQEIFVRVSDLTNQCYVIKSFLLNFGDDVIAPTVGFGYTPATICVSSSSGNLNPTLLDGFSIGGQFTTNNTGLQINPTTGVINLGTSLAGEYQVSYHIDAQGCTTSGDFTTSITLTNLVVTAPESGTYCNTYTLPDLATVGNYYTEPNGGGIMLSVNDSITETSTLYVYAVDGECIGQDSFTVTINSVPTPTFNVTQPTCEVQSGTIQVTAPISSGSLVSDLVISEITDESVGSLSYIEIYNGTGSAKNLADYKLKIYNNGNSTPSNFCDFALSGTLNNNEVYVIAVGDNTNQGGVVPDFTVANCPGFNTNDNVRLTTSSDVVVDVWGRNDGNDFTPNNEAGYTYRRNTSATLPSVAWIETDWTAIDPQDYTNVGSYTYNNTVSNYLYILDSGTPQSGVTFSEVTSGTHTLVVQDTTTGCFSLPVEVIVDPVPTANADTAFTYTTPVCQNATANPLPIPTNATFTTGGTYSEDLTISIGLVINSTTGEIDLASSTTGTHTIKYEVIGCSTPFSSTFAIVINPIITPNVSFGYTTPVCKNATNPTPTPAPVTSGGQYSEDTSVSTGLAINATTGEIDLANSTAGSHTIIYSVPVNAASCQLAGSSTFVIVINPVTTLDSSFSYATPVCAGDVSVLPTGTFAPGGLFSASPVGLLINPNTGEIDLSSPSASYTITYTPNPNTANCEVGSPSTAPFVISNPVEVALSGECNGSIFELTATPVNGSFNPETATYQWYNSSGLIPGNNGATLSVSLVGDYSVTVNSAGCNGSANISVISVACDIQRGISPGGSDDLNNNFELSNLDVKKLEIFNRYGLKVYSKSNYTNEWSGQSDNGEELPDGTYFYVIELNNEKSKTGWIYINREIN